MSARSIGQVSAHARRAVLALAGALAMTLPLAPVAWAQAKPGATPPSATAPATAATTAPATAPATAATTTTATPSRACRKAKARVAGEERSIGKVQRSIDKASAGSTKCSTKPVCDQYATKITELEALRTRREARLTKYRSAADKACAAR